MLLRSATRSANGRVVLVTMAISHPPVHRRVGGEVSASCWACLRSSRSDRRYTPLSTVTSPSFTMRVRATRVARSAIPNSSPTFTKALIGSAGGWYPSSVLNATDLAVSEVIDGRCRSGTAGYIHELHHYVLHRNVLHRIDRNALTHRLMHNPNVDAHYQACIGCC